MPRTCKESGAFFTCQGFLTPAAMSGIADICRHVSERRQVNGTISAGPCWVQTGGAPHLSGFSALCGSRRGD